MCTYSLTKDDRFLHGEQAQDGTMLWRGLKYLVGLGHDARIMASEIPEGSDIGETDLLKGELIVLLDALWTFERLQPRAVSKSFYPVCI